MHFGELTEPEQRVLGCLIEKRWTTPDQYPLSLNALRLACNQATNRDPVTDYDEATVNHAAQRLSHYGLARLASFHGSRATKYRHLAEEALGVDREHLALLCVLLLRGPQTPGELKGRSERLARLATLADVDRVLGELAQLGYVARMDRRPGQKEDRFRHLLGGDGDGSASSAEAVPAPRLVPAAAAMQSTPGVAADGPEAPPPARASDHDRDRVRGPVGAPGADGGLAARVSALEAEVAPLRAEVARLRAELDDLLN